MLLFATKKSSQNIYLRTYCLSVCAIGDILLLQHLEYNAEVKPALEFLQEKLLNYCLPPSRKVTTSYEQLYWAIDCMEQKMAIGEAEEPEDEDATQFEVEYVQ